MTRLAICIPCYGDTKAKFTLSLANALVFAKDCKIVGPDGEPVGIEIETFMVASSMLTESRHRLIAEALAWNATHALWLDADHVFPADVIPRLLAHNVDVVGANYPRRCIPTAPTAARHIDDDHDNRNLVYTTLEKAQDGELEEVDHLGFGVCLMNMRIIDALQVKADETDGNILPLFYFQPREDKVGMIGEDVFFFAKVRDAGCKVYCDHGLSWEVGHIHEQILTNAHALTQKDRWEEFCRTKADKFSQKAAELEA